MRYTPLLTALVLSGITATANAQNAYDSRITGYVGLRYPCGGSVQPVLRVQNVGQQTMTSCDIDVLKNGLTATTFNWVLASAAATGETRQPALPVLNDVQEGDVLEFHILTVNGQPDQDEDGNVMDVPMTDAKGDAGSYEVRVEVMTDDAPEETTWAIKDALGNVLVQGGPYAEANELKQTDVELPAGACTNFEVYDSGGDGLSGTRSPGYARVLSLGQEVVAVQGDFGSLFREGVATGTAAGCYDTKLTGTADPLISCGATGLRLDGTSTLWTTEVAGADRYQFHFTNVPHQPAYIRSIASPTRSLVLNRWATLPLKPGRTYNVQVRSSFDGGASWCPYGQSCTISISYNALTAGGRRMLTMDGNPGDIVLSPNPVAAGPVQLTVDGLVPSDELVALQVFDAMGRVAVERSVRVADLDAPVMVDLGSLDAGVYVVRIDGSAQRLVVR